MILAATGSATATPKERPGGAGPRIVGGTPAAGGQFPWQAALVRSPEVAPGSAAQRQFCGGALLAPTAVATAAHCLHDAASGSLVPPTDVNVVTGRTILSSTEGRETGVVEYFMYRDASGNPLFDPVSKRWDVAILILEAPAAGGPIKLPGPDESGISAPGRSAFVSGWGQTSGTDPATRSDVLRSAQLTILPDSSCSAFSYDPSVMLCAGAAEASPCYGDSGGPLAAPTATGDLRLIGLVSKGFDFCPTGAGVVFTRIAVDPIRSAVRATVIERTGIDPVAPRRFTKSDARNRAARYAKRACRRDHRCTGSSVRRCVNASAGFRCVVVKRAAVGCRRAILVTERRTRPLSRWRCS